jgi:hypothetical protein
VETVEAFCAEHKIDVDSVLYEWPASRFEALYEAFAKRKVADELSQKRALELAAVWGNPNLDTKENPKLRQELQADIDEAYSQAIYSLYNDVEDEEEEIDKDDPFFAAMQRGLKKRGIEVDQVGG